jgi:hypothetical protein
VRVLIFGCVIVSQGSEVVQHLEVLAQITLLEVILGEVGDLGVLVILGVLVRREIRVHQYIDEYCPHLSLSNKNEKEPLMSSL